MAWQSELLGDESPGLHLPSGRSREPAVRMEPGRPIGVRKAGSPGWMRPTLKRRSPNRGEKPAREVDAFRSGGEAAAGSCWPGRTSAQRTQRSSSGCSGCSGCSAGKPPQMRHPGLEARGPADGAGGLMDFGSHPHTARKRAARLAALLSLIAPRGGARIAGAWVRMHRVLHWPHRPLAHPPHGKVIPLSSRLHPLSVAPLADTSGWAPRIADGGKGLSGLLAGTLAFPPPGRCLSGASLLRRGVADLPLRGSISV